MTHEAFEQECDRLSHIVDSVSFERLRWSRTEGPMLAHLVALLHGVLEGREDFELTEEGSTNALKRFVLKVHSNRVMAVTISLEPGRVILAAEEIERSKYKLSDDSPIYEDYNAVDEQWMSLALQELFRRVHQ